MKGSRMLSRLIILMCAAGLLAGCAASDPLAKAHGPLFALNPGHWSPSSAQLAQPPQVPHS